MLSSSPMARQTKLFVRHTNLKNNFLLTKSFFHHPHKPKKKTYTKHILNKREIILRIFYHII